MLCCCSAGSWTVHSEALAGIGSAVWCCAVWLVSFLLSARGREGTKKNKTEWDGQMDRSSDTVQRSMV